MARYTSIFRQERLALACHGGFALCGTCGRLEGFQAFLHALRLSSVRVLNCLTRENTYLGLNDLPPLTQPVGQNLPHLLPAGKIFLRKKLELLMIPVFDMTTLDEPLMSLAARVRGLVREVSSSYGLPIQTRCSGSEKYLVVRSAPDGRATLSRCRWLRVRCSSSCDRPRHGSSDLLGHDRKIVEEWHVRSS